MKVDLVQFLRGNGRQKLVTMELPDECRESYQDMINHDCRFEIEVLTIGAVLTTISQDGEDLDCRVTVNGPQVQGGMIAMLKQKDWRRQGVSDETG